MLRAAVLTLLVASILTGPLEAQRAGGGFRGRASGPAVRSGLVGQHSFSKGFFPLPGSANGFFPAGTFFPNRFRFRRGAFGGFPAPYFFPGYVPFFPDYGPFSPEYGPFWYVQPYADGATEAPPVMLIERPDVEQSPRLATAAVKAQIIEVPGAANSNASKTLLPTIFILANGERLESRRFVLTASNLSISIDRHERTIPLDMLDLRATVAANRKRGIDLRIPADRSEISLSF
jgi:hypothetical protein